MPLFKLDCQVQHYPWGSLTAIPDLLGRDNSSALPWAELWMGAHAKAPSALPSGELLSDFLKRQNDELSFLFKILAADAPLSIQCHPNKQQAAEGFAKENAAGIAIDAANRNYRDANHKPEIIVALDEFWALKGFRDPAEIASLLDRAKIHSFRGELKQGIEAFCRRLYDLKPQETSRILQCLSANCGALPANEARWSSELLRLYPDDIGCLAALFLHVIKLSPGQALYLGAGELHAYLRGTGLELMANSDNVLRGGLTSKHVDPEELLRVLRFEPSTTQVLCADEQGRYPCPSDEFLLTQLALGDSQIRRPTSNEIWLCLGEADIQCGDDAQSLSRGEVIFCTGDTGGVSLSGTGHLWIAEGGATISEGRATIRSAVERCTT